MTRGTIRCGTGEETYEMIRSSQLASHHFPPVLLDTGRHLLYSAFSSAIFTLGAAGTTPSPVFLKLQSHTTMYEKGGILR